MDLLLLLRRTVIGEGHRGREQVRAAVTRRGLATTRNRGLALRIDILSTIRDAMCSTGRRGSRAVAIGDHRRLGTGFRRDGAKRMRWRS
jgi:hypothetical protein